MDTLLDRFLRYVRIETTADESSPTYPSSECQRDLAKVLHKELQSMGLEATLDEHAIVSALLPGNVDGAPTIAWFAHMDTSPEASGKGVDPQVVERYSGGDLPLKNGRSIPAADLAGFEGKSLVTTDGTTLLGADDKAGIAVIMTAVDRLMATPDKPRCPVRVVFTCDEEIGRGTDKLDLNAIDAVCGYTLDDRGEGSLGNETFSADVAVVTISGQNTHPGQAYKKMCNAVRVGAAFLEQLPPEISPEQTRDRESFLHPYDIDGEVAEVKIRILLRSFVTSELAELADRLRQAAEATTKLFPEATVRVDVQEQYRNMADFLEKEPRAVNLAQAAYRKVGFEPHFRAIRGGTDGSRLSELGLPTPNIFTGMHNIHSELEFACLDEMESAVLVLMELASLWSQERE